MCLHVCVQTSSPLFWCNSKWLLDMLWCINYFLKLCVNSYLLKKKLKNVLSLSTFPMNFNRLNSSHPENSKVQYMQRRQNTKFTLLSLNCGCRVQSESSLAIFRSRRSFTDAKLIVWGARLSVSFNRVFFLQLWAASNVCFKKKRAT